ncbi:MAG: HAD-IA family hydrolase [Bacteroidetes bacterium]|jgi:HAD superfamily hydrolase (TIGR01509 family)|nr:HAD-IA family hydrolase [Bacteroidota bacterium]
MQKAVIFDMDGTLVDNMQIHEKSFMKFLKKHDIHLSMKEYRAVNYGSIFEIIPRIFGNNLQHDEIKSLGEEKEEVYRKMYAPLIKEIEGLTNFLKELKQQEYLIGLATMGDLKNTEFTLNALGIMPLFDSLTTGEEVESGKPDPEIFLLAMHKMNVTPECSYIVEDSVTGIQAAVASGAQVIGITTSLNESEIRKLGVNRVIHNYEGVFTEAGLTV